MEFSMSFNKLKKVMAVATFLATISCLVPEFAEALPPALVSGASRNGSFVFFEIANSTGDYNEIIKNLKFASIEGENNELMCKKNFQGISEFNEFVSQFDDNQNIFFCVGLKSAILQKQGDKIYQATFDLSENNRLEGFEENSLSSFMLELKINDPLDIKTIDMLTIKYIKNDDKTTYNYVFINGGTECSKEFADGEEAIKACNIETIPDPSGTTSFLGAGAIGAVSLLKRNKRSRKPASSRLNLSEEKTRT